MLYDKVHAPVARTMCAQCHEPPGSPERAGGEAGGSGCAAAATAHKVTAMLEKNRVHQPVVEGKACLNCHGPHASKQAGLLRGDRPRASAATATPTPSAGRRDRWPSTSRWREGDCATCHDPALRERRAAARQQRTRSRVCGKCHEWTTHSSHPLGDKIVDPRNKNLKLECLSCHRAHGTEFNKLMPYAKQTDICVKCHESYRR